MSAWFVFKAKVVRLFGIALAVAGFVSVLYFTALVTWKGEIPFLPELNPEAWLPDHQAAAWFAERVQIGILFAALGALIMAGGAFLAVRQTALLRAEQGRREDGLRRVRQYRGDEARQQAHERLEPFIGPGTATGREADRRVA